MTSIDVGTYGAKVQSWRRSNPRDLLKTLIEENAGASKETFLREIRDRLKEPKNEDFLDVVIEYWFTNNYNSLIDEAGAPERRAAAKVQKAAKVSEIKKKLKARIRQEAQIILLDMVLPNGKALRESTGRDCAKAGGLFAKIASKVKPNEIVGDVLDESAVRKLYGR